MPPPSPLGVGLGLRRPFIHEIAETLPGTLDWLEIAPENYIGRGGRIFRAFEKIAAHYPLIAHGLSLSLGSLDELDWDYLKELKKFLRTYRIAWFSDHLCFASTHTHHFHDLLPLPLTMEAVRHVSRRAGIVQDFLEIPLAVENVSCYMHPEPPEMSEVDFVLEVLNHAPISLMLDVNNVFVNSVNHGFDPYDYLAALDSAPILQIHIAGHFREEPTLIIDTHGTAVGEEVWRLLDFLGRRRVLPPILIERDNNIPPLATLYHEVEKAREIYNNSQRLGKIEQPQSLLEARA